MIPKILIGHFVKIVLILHCVCLNTAAFYCDQDYCGSTVSKCILTQSCVCAQKDQSCYKDCIRCMGTKYFNACCGCLDMCPKSSLIKTSLSQRSHVEDFQGVPELFDVLVSSISANQLETSLGLSKFSINYETSFLLNPHLTTNQMRSGKIEKMPHTKLSVNCTVVYFNHCISWNKCRHNCRSTGASSYRWFHDGCCECVGSTCRNYGLNESRCKFCPEEEDVEFEEEFDEDGFYETEYFDGYFRNNEN